MPPDSEILESMRRDWNDRAREDANYYVAFGRRGQEDAEFLASAADVMRHMRMELQRIPEHARQRALEIGCGPGRLLRPASEYFQEIHGVDVSDEMVRLAAQRLADIPHAHVHSTSGSDVAAFADNYFDFVYSYAVFQHIPSRDVVFQYLAEARRVLKPGGILWCQINGLPAQAARYTTWEGVRISAEEISGFARTHDFQLLRLEGIETQYMWMTCRKQVSGWSDWLEHTEWTTIAQLRSVHNAHSSEAAIPASGRFAAAALSIENLPPDCDINRMDVRIEGRPARVSYIGSPQRDGVVQVNIALPQDIRTGLLPLDLDWMGKPLCPSGIIRIIPPAPLVPMICSLTDGVDLLSGTRIASGIVKVTMEEVVAPEIFLASVDDKPVFDPDFFCTDPQTRRFEINFHLPQGTAPGPHVIEVRLGRRKFPPIAIEVA
jgi:cyclopropane fatty-acyl-phospholipid synthase-like methyltransferase